ncbi:MAG: hypothetical protein OXI60_06885 [Acidiferrobacterales bacterium]|nr:hypothetical protein [Acidiferrobacterales bacterium]
MQFVYVLISLICLVGVIWLITRRMRLTGLRLPMIGVKDSESRQNQSHTQDGHFLSASSSVNLGPVQSVDREPDGEYEQTIDLDAELSDLTVNDARESESYSIEENEADHELWQDDANLSEAEESEEDKVWSHDLDAESDPADISEPQFATSDELDAMTDTDASQYSADEPDGYHQEGYDSNHDEDAETEIGSVLPVVEESGPYFGGNLNIQTEAEHLENDVEDLSWHTELKLPDSEDDSQSDDPDVDQLVQTELEVSVVFPDYRNSQDREIDVVGWLPAELDVIRRMDVLTVYKNLEFQLDHPHSIIGFDVDKRQWNNLEMTEVVSDYSDLILTLQLSHNGQAVSEKNWWKFTRMVGHIAVALSRNFHFSMTTDTVIREGSLLTSQIEGLDLQAILLLRTSQESRFSNKGIRYLAREYDLLERPGMSVFDRFDSESDLFPLFSIVPVNESNTELAEELGQDPDMRTMILFSNLACVPDPRRAFDTMYDLAKELEDRLVVKLVDQNHQPIDYYSISQIRTKIDEFVERMNSHGIPPGGDSAIRLFDSSLMVQNWAESKGIVSLIPTK